MATEAQNTTEKKESWKSPEEWLYVNLAKLDAKVDKMFESKENPEGTARKMANICRRDAKIFNMIAGGTMLQQSPESLIPLSIGMGFDMASTYLNSKADEFAKKKSESQEPPKEHARLTKIDNPQHRPVWDSGEKQ